MEKNTPRVIKEAKTVELIQVVYLGGKENSQENPLRLITEYRSKDGKFLGEYDAFKCQKGN